MISALVKRFYFSYYMRRPESHTEYDRHLTNSFVWLLRRKKHLKEGCAGKTTSRQQHLSRKHTAIRRLFRNLTKQPQCCWKLNSNKPKGKWDLCNSQKANAAWKTYQPAYISPAVLVSVQPQRGSAWRSSLGGMQAPHCCHTLSLSVETTHMFCKGQVAGWETPFSSKSSESEWISHVQCVKPTFGLNSLPSAERSSLLNEIDEGFSFAEVHSWDESQVYFKLNFNR